jgi:hypothetical protein
MGIQCCEVSSWVKRNSRMNDHLTTYCPKLRCVAVPRMKIHFVLNAVPEFSGLRLCHSFSQPNVTAPRSPEV